MFKNLFMDWYGIRPWVVIVAVLVGITALCWVGIVAANNTSKKECSLIQKQSGHRTKYVKWYGCYVEVNGSFVPVENWRVEE